MKCLGFKGEGEDLGSKGVGLATRKRVYMNTCYLVSTSIKNV